jgi:hypothetical protein
MKKELVKPSSIKDRVEKEVESLCDGFSCDSLTASPPPVDTGDVSEILF